VILPKFPTGSDEHEAPQMRVDVREMACPFTWVKTRVALDAIAVGEKIEVLLMAGEPLENIPRTAEEEGHEVAACFPFPEAGKDVWRLLLVKGREQAEAGLLP